VTEFKDFSKTGFSGPENLFGKGEKEPEAFKPESFVVEAEDDRPDQLKQWEKTLEDPKLAKKAWDLFIKWPEATLPELILWMELKERNVVFDYQVAILGGTRKRGGLIPDFLVKRGGEGLAIEVNGSYWHEGAEKQEKDRADALRMKGVLVNGVRIKQVVTVWDVDLYPSKDRRRITVDNALAGISVRY
jgi:hypothetical protein